MNKPKTVKVVKTNKLNQQKLVKIARRYNIPPISVRELQLGFTEAIPEAAANKLIEDGFVKKSKARKRTEQEKVDNFTVDKTNIVTVDDTDNTTLNNENKINNIDNNEETTN